MINIDWLNTPGGYYAVAYWISCCMVLLNSPRKIEWKKSLISTGLLGIALYILMTVTHGSPQWLFVPFMVSYFLLMWITINYNCRYDWKTAFYFTARAFIIGEFIASFEWQLFYYAVNYTDIPVNLFSIILFVLIIDGMIVFIMYRLEKKNWEVNQSIQVSGHELRSVVIITLAIFAVSNMSYVLEDTPLGDGFVQNLLVIRTLVDLGGVAILYAYHVQMGELKTRFEMEKLQDILNMQFHNYEMLEQSVNVVNQKYHDLKYQIAILKKETNEKESLEYLNQMENEIKAYEAQNKTGNKVLDIILTGKALYCQNNWIELTSVADGTLLERMDPIDISTLFGNMLDNAIESVSKIEKKEKRLIHLTVSQQKQFLRIKMENCYKEKLIFDNGMPTTTKKDKNLHGYGLKSIQSTVKKYGGSVTVQAENGWFELRILIPLNS